VTRFITCPQHIRSADLGQAIVILDSRTGRVETLLGAARYLWLALARTGDVQAAQAAGIDAKQADQLTGRLLADELLTTATLARSWQVPRAAVTAPSWGTQEVPAGLPRSASPPKGRLGLATNARELRLLGRLS
jgi:hypothetical protein